VSQANLGTAAHCAGAITADLDQLLLRGLDAAQTWCLREFDLWLGQRIKRDLGHE
jgi:hypothetical protein